MYALNRIVFENTFLANSRWDLHKRETLRCIVVPPPQNLTKAKIAYYSSGSDFNK